MTHHKGEKDEEGDRLLLLLMLRIRGRLGGSGAGHQRDAQGLTPKAPDADTNAEENGGKEVAAIKPQGDSS